jgi:hypothetical protein
MPDGWDGRLEQVWFVGAHTNVGGGYKDSHLSDIALLWMVERARTCGLDFDAAYLDWFVTAEPRHSGWIGDELKGPYRLLGRAERAVTEDAARRLAVHDTVAQRWNDPSLGYRPAHLRHLAARLGRPSDPPGGRDGGR